MRFFLQEQVDREANDTFARLKRDFGFGSDIKKPPPPKRRSFWVYFWKSYYRKTKKHQWCVKWKGKNLIVRGFVIRVPVESKSRKRNPHAVVCGKATSIIVRNKIAYIS